MSFTMNMPLLGSLVFLCLVILAQIACSTAPQVNLTESAQVTQRETSDADMFVVNTASVDLQRGETSHRVNLNTASREELMRLPGIGTGLAARIIEYRTRFGRFRRPEHLLMVQGIGARRFNTLQQFIEAK